MRCRLNGLGGEAARPKSGIVSSACLLSLSFAWPFGGSYRDVTRRSLQAQLNRGIDNVGNFDPVPPKKVTVQF